MPIQTTEFIALDFDVPTTFITRNFYFRMLEPSVAKQDYDAVMSSIKRLRYLFGPSSVWPQNSMTLEENTASLKVHQQEFNSRTAFAYSVFDKSNTRCIGSVYIDPSQSPNYHCEVYFWIRDDNVYLENDLYDTINHWLKNSWPFTKIVFPGRSVEWKSWSKEINHNR